MPDYLTTKGWVEVMGVGDDQTLKLKLDKLMALHFWRLLMPVDLWVYDSRRDRHAEAPIERVNDLVMGTSVDRFPEGQPYYEISAEELFEEAA
jgi:hypothetical protein